MTHLIKQVASGVLALTLFFSLSVHALFAATYGEGLYGQGLYNQGATPTPTATTDSGSTSDTVSSSTPQPPGCGVSAPGTAPWLFAAVPQSETSILLYFTPADDPLDHYSLLFGTASGNYEFGADNIGGKGTGTYLVKSLRPNTTYYFKVRGGNGCAPGPWSQELAAKTKSFLSLTQLTTTDFDLTPNGTSVPDTLEKPVVAPSTVATGSAQTQPDEQEIPTVLGSYNLKIAVKDPTNQPVAGAVVTVHSTVQESTTDENGIAYFSNVEPGEHRVIVAYDGFSGEQSVNVTGAIQEINISITVEKKNVLTSPAVLSIVGGLGLIILILVIILLRKSK